MAHIGAIASSAGSAPPPAPVALTPSTWYSSNNAHPEYNAQWPVAPLPEALIVGAVATDGADIYLVGGEQQSGGTAIATCRKYSPVSNAYSLLPALPAIRKYLAAFVLNGYLWAIGGAITNNTKQTTAYRLDLGNPVSWETRASDNLSIGHWMMNAYVVDGSAYLVCGEWTDAPAGSFKILKLTPGSGWAQVGANTRRWARYAAGVLGTKIIGAGGWDGGSVVNRDAWEWDTATSGPQSVHSQTVTQYLYRVGGDILQGKLYMVGGTNTSSVEQRELNIYNPQGGSSRFSIGPVPPQAVRFPRCVTVNNILYCFGGSNAGTYLADVAAFAGPDGADRPY